MKHLIVCKLSPINYSTVLLLMGMAFDGFLATDRHYYESAMEIINNNRTKFSWE